MSNSRDGDGRVKGDEDQDKNTNERRSRGSRASRSRSRSNSRGRYNDKRRRRRSPSRSKSRSRSRSPRGDRRRDDSKRDGGRREPNSPTKPRRKGMWDKAPPGYEGMNVAQVATLNPSVLTPLITPSNTLLQSRQARRLYVGNVSLSITDAEVMEFFNAAMVAAKLVPAGINSVVGCQMNHEKNYAFIEFRSPEEATSAMAFDGMTLQNNILKVRRPKDYVAPSGSPNHAPMPASPLRDDEPTNSHIPGIIGTNVTDSPSKVFLGGLPPYLNAEQVRELVSTFGQLKSFHLVMDTVNSSMSKGYAFLEYLEDSVTDRACQGLNGMHIGDKTLIMHRSAPSTSKSSDTPSLPSSSSTTTTSAPGSIQSLPASNPLLTATLLGMPYMGPTSPPPPTTTLLLLNMASSDEISLEPEYQAMVDDVKEECAKLGPVKAVVIPRQGKTLLVKVYVQYESKDDALRAHQSIGGRRYNGRTIVAHFVDDVAIN